MGSLAGFNLGINEARESGEELELGLPRPRELLKLGY